MEAKLWFKLEVTSWFSLVALLLAYLFFPDAGTYLFFGMIPLVFLAGIFNALAKERKREDTARRTVILSTWQTTKSLALLSLAIGFLLGLWWLISQLLSNVFFALIVIAVGLVSSDILYRLIHKFRKQRRSKAA